MSEPSSLAATLVVDGLIPAVLLRDESEVVDVVELPTPPLSWPVEVVSIPTSCELLHLISLSLLSNDERLSKGWAKFWKEHACSSILKAVIDGALNQRFRQRKFKNKKCFFQPQFELKKIITLDSQYQYNQQHDAGQPDCELDFVKDSLVVKLSCSLWECLYAFNGGLEVEITRKTCLDHEQSDAQEGDFEQRVGSLANLEAVVSKYLNEDVFCSFAQRNFLALSSKLNRLCSFYHVPSILDRCYDSDAKRKSLFKARGPALLDEAEVVHVADTTLRRDALSGLVKPGRERRGPLKQLPTQLSPSHEQLPRLSPFFDSVSDRSALTASSGGALLCASMVCNLVSEKLCCCNEWPPVVASEILLVHLRLLHALCKDVRAKMLRSLSQDVMTRCPVDVLRAHSSAFESSLIRAFPLFLSGPSEDAGSFRHLLRSLSALYLRCFQRHSHHLTNGIDRILSYAQRVVVGESNLTTILLKELSPLIRYMGVFAAPYLEELFELSCDNCMSLQKKSTTVSLCFLSVVFETIPKPFNDHLKSKALSFVVKTITNTKEAEVQGEIRRALIDLVGYLFETPEEIDALEDVLRHEIDTTTTTATQALQLIRKLLMIALSNPVASTSDD